MDKASSGDDEAFGALAAAVQDEIYRFALAHGLNRPDAAEAAQETLLRAYQARRRWRSGADAVAWLYGIAMNVAREFRKKHRRRAEAGGVDPAILAGNDGAAADEDCEQLARLAAAIGRLPQRQQETVTCRFLRRMSVRETAEAMGCAEGTVRAAVSAALENLRKTFGRQP